MFFSENIYPTLSPLSHTPYPPRTFARAPPLLTIHCQTNVKDDSGRRPGEEFARWVSAEKRQAVKAVVQPAREREAARELRSIVERLGRMTICLFVFFAKPPFCIGIHIHPKYFSIYIYIYVCAVNRGRAWNLSPNVNIAYPNGTWEGWILRYCKLNKNCGNETEIFMILSVQYRFRFKTNYKL